MFNEYSYKDICLVPANKLIVGSRKDCDTSVMLGGRRFTLPVIPANMKSVVDEESCKYFAKKGMFYIMHRFGISVPKFARTMRYESPFVSISVGENKESYEALEEIKKDGTNPDYITLDVAYAWCEKGEKMIKYIKENFPKSYLIAGNVATYEGAFALYSWGADCVKAGIGTGNVCITRNKTGFFRPIVSTLFDCCGNKNLPIIGDGGISEHQDVAKGIACGAHMVMAGSMFSGFDQSAGSLVEIDGKKYKEYYGNASEFTKMKKQNVEGKKILVPYKGNMDDMLSEMTEDLQSSISYSGGKDLTSLRFYNAFNIRFVRN